MKIALHIFIAIFLLTACATQSVENISQPQSTEEVVTHPTQIKIPAEILPGIYKIDSLASALGTSNVAIVANHTSQINGLHLLDTLLSLGVNVKKVFAPEHGFRGDESDGAVVDNSVDKRTGIVIESLYGKTKKPSASMLAGVDVLVFDIQDVGARFYTFLSTLHNIMEAAAENNIQVIVLDRPNPNGFYVDGPVLKEQFSSFVGMHPIPVVHGMTLGELAGMINAEGWLAGKVVCKLQVVKCENYSHSSLYQLPIKPSPNLPDMTAIYLYPSLCFFEGTEVSVGRGTDAPFTQIGEPGNQSGNFTFTPKSIKGASENPKHKGMLCRGYDLRDTLNKDALPDTLQLSWLLKMYSESPDQKNFFLSSGYFNLLAGTDQLKKDIIAGKTLSDIHASWQPDLEKFKAMRKKYLLYPDF